jgi:predicted ABC-class ATPase
MREKLSELGLIAFVCNGSLLPRKSGIRDTPLDENSAVLFRSPDSLEVTIQLPDGSSATGMGIPKGITLIAGGGYHGKSTLLKGIERGVYNHIPGDGREKTVTLYNAVKIRAEDGRSIEKVDISPFISNLPLGKTTEDFSTDDASGSTSQAGNIMEVLEIGTGLLLVDEDTSATNFLVRDERMQALVAKEKEPITPFIDRVKELSEKHGVSTILVMGGCGDYFSVADRVIMMDNFIPRDVTQKAREIVSANPVKRKCEIRGALKEIPQRIPQPGSFPKPVGRKPLKIQAKSLHHIRVSKTTIDLLYCEQLVDPSQTRAIAAFLKTGLGSFIDGSHTMSEIVQIFFKKINEKGLEFFSHFGYPAGDLAFPRGIELACAINRIRGIRMKQKKEDPSTPV